MLSPATAPEMLVDISYDYQTNSASAQNISNVALHLGVTQVSYLFPQRRRSMTQTNDQVNSSELPRHECDEVNESKPN